MSLYFFSHSFALDPKASRSLVIEAMRASYSLAYSFPRCLASAFEVGVQLAHTALRPFAQGGDDVHRIGIIHLAEVDAELLAHAFEPAAQHVVHMTEHAA